MFRYSGDIKCIIFIKIVSRGMNYVGNRLNKEYYVSNNNKITAFLFLFKSDWVYLVTRKCMLRINVIGDDCDVICALSVCPFAFKFDWRN